jgi:arylformamidase
MDLQAGYHNRLLVPEHPAIIAGSQRDAAAFPAAWPEAELGIPYGAGGREELDLFQPDAGDDWPVALSDRGGYWQELDRSYFSAAARGFVAQGVALAVPSCDLCPTVTLARIVEQMRAAAAAPHRRTRRRILADGALRLGHPTAMPMATDWRALAPRLPAGLLPAGLSASGAFELEPLLPTTIGAGPRLTPAKARAVSPRFLPSLGHRLHAAVGGAERVESLFQTRGFAAARGRTAEVLEGAPLHGPRPLGRSREQPRAPGRRHDPRDSPSRVTASHPCGSETLQVEDRR